MRRFTQGVAPLFSRDLHVLGTPPAFVLSQDQTLQLSWSTPSHRAVPRAGESKRAFANLARTKQSRVVHDHYAWDLLRTAYSLEKGRYYLVFKDRVLLRADLLL